jgi:cytochrome c556
MLRKTIVISLMVLVTAAGPVSALDLEQASQAAETRQSVMTVIRWNVVPMAGMVKEQIPYDSARFRLHAGRVGYMATMIVDAYRANTSEYPLETEALDVIWTEFDEFERLAVALQEQADALNNVAMGDDFAATKAAFLDVGQACKNCHDKFREEDD